MPTPRLSFSLLASLRIVTVFMVLVSAHATLAAPLAVLSDVKGKVQVVRAGTTSDGKNGSLLEVGDAVRVVEGSATIFYATRPPQAIKTGAMLQLKATSTATIKPTVWRSLFTNLSNGFARRDQSQPLTTRIPLRNIPQPVAPSGSLIKANPTFVWTEVINLPRLNFQDYEFDLLDAEGNIIWRSTTKSTFLTYPDDAPALGDGTPYTWQVVGRCLNTSPGMRRRRPIPNEQLRGPKRTFTIAPAARRLAVTQQVQKLETDMADDSPVMRRMAVASLLSERGFFADALAKLKPSQYDPAATANSTPDAEALDETTKVLIEAISARMAES